MSPLVAAGSHTSASGETGIEPPFAASELVKARFIGSVQHEATPAPASRIGTNAEAVGISRTEVIGPPATACPYYAQARRTGPRSLALISCQQC
jgi:hypothetical protein